MRRCRCPSGPHNDHRGVSDDGVDACAHEPGSTARGALWLATNGIVVKAAHTVVLLTLAALLTPSALGLVALGSLVANVAAILGTLGTASALVHLEGSTQRVERAAANEPDKRQPVALQNAQADFSQDIRQTLRPESFDRSGLPVPFRDSQSGPSACHTEERPGGCV